MDDQNKVENLTHEESSLRPIPYDKRILGPASLFFLWLGGCINMGNFTLGTAQYEKGLNITQVLVAMLIGFSITVVLKLLNDQFGYTTGAPFAIQIKAAFGAKGSILPTAMRAAPALVYYGFQSWLAASAMNNISKVLIGYSNIWLFFALFQALQIFLSIKGFKTVKWVENVGGIVLLITITYMLYICVSQYGDQMQSLFNREGTWGLPFISAMLVFMGNAFCLLLNMGDYSRETKPNMSVLKRGIIYWIPDVPVTMVLGVIGFMSFAATGNANPVDAFSMMVNNKFLLVITLLFVLFAQVTTNLASNVIPCVYAFMDLLKMKHTISCVVVGLLAVATCPWLLATSESAAGFDLFVKLYSSFFAPVASIMIVDYFLVHKRKISPEFLEDLYDEKGNHRGINWAAIIAVIVGAAVSAVTLDFSVVLAPIPAALIYYYGTKHMVSCSRFRKGTVFEKAEE